MCSITCVVFCWVPTIQTNARVYVYQGLLHSYNPFIYKWILQDGIALYFKRAFIIFHLISDKKVLKRGKALSDLDSVGQTRSGSLTIHTCSHIHTTHICAHRRNSVPWKDVTRLANHLVSLSLFAPQITTLSFRFTFSSVTNRTRLQMMVLSVALFEILSK